MNKFFYRIANTNIPRWVILQIDVILSACSMIISLAILNSLTTLPTQQFHISYPLFIFLLFRVQGFLITRSYAGILKYTSIKDAFSLFISILLSSGAMFVIETLYRNFTDQSLVTYTFIIVDSFILITFLSAFRIGVKLIHQEFTSINGSAKKSIIIYGAGEAGVLAKRTIESDLRFNAKVVAFIDDDRKLQGKTAEGVKVYDSVEGLEFVIQKFQPKELLIAMQRVKPYRKKRVIERCLRHNINVKSVPPIETWINGSFNANQIKSIKIEDLLQRDEINLDFKKIKKEIADKVVLITGAAGSIGSEIVRQSLNFKPSLLVLVDQAESPLYELEQELGLGKKIEIVVASVCNQARMRKVFEHFKPDYVFHAAAYKHVPLMEDNPYEAINTNIFGTRTVANLAVEYNAKKFVFISTDKAVNPTNIMGASKRVAEIFVQSLNSKLDLVQENHTKFITTRFGNVLGSNGSVIPLFKKQIEKGGPITVTHPEITRYFMTIPEACQLVLEAGVMGRGGEIYIFDMGESVKIVDLAKKMIVLSGLVENKDIEIVFSGLRPGEKLKEELLNDFENTVGTHNPKIMIAKVRQYNFLEVNDIIENLYTYRDTLNNRNLVQNLKVLVPEYLSNNSIYEELDKKLIES